MRAHSIDYQKDEGRKPGTLVNRGWWVRDLPRLTPVCRMLGHLPVVDGTGKPGERGHLSRWVCCDRCGVRPEPQGRLDPDVWDIGQRYTGKHAEADRPGAWPKRADWIAEMTAGKPGHHPPGPWPASPTGTIGGQIVIGKSNGGAGVALMIGAAGNENDLSGHIHANPLGGLYWHTEGFGKWLQRRLIPEGYDDRAFELALHGRLSWKVFAKDGSWTKGTPRWQDGSARVDPRDLLLGERRYSYEQHGDPVTGVVRMPEGDDHEVLLTLKQQRHGRRRGRASTSWTVSWESGKGIPYRNHDWKGDEVLASAVSVTEASVERGRWAEDACAAIAAQISEDRSRYGWRPRTTATEAS